MAGILQDFVDFPVLLYTVLHHVLEPLVYRFQYNKERDSPSETRNLILVIVTLIAAVSFQAGVNPPGGFWQDNQNGHVAGSSVLASRNQLAFCLFLIFNTAALSVSTFIIITFTSRFPLKFEIWLASLCMLATYVSAVVALIPPESEKLCYTLLLVMLPIVMRISMAICRYCLCGSPRERPPTRVEYSRKDVVLSVDDLRRLIRNIIKEYAYREPEDLLYADIDYDGGVGLSVDDLLRLIKCLKQKGTASRNPP